MFCRYLFKDFVCCASKTVFVGTRELDNGRHMAFAVAKQTHSIDERNKRVYQSGASGVLLDSFSQLFLKIISFKPLIRCRFLLTIALNTFL